MKDTSIRFAARVVRLALAALLAGLALFALPARVALAQSPVDGFNPGADARVLAIAVQPDSKIVVGGDFSTLGGGGMGTTPRSYIGRLNADGSLDAAFNPGAGGPVKALAVQPDGKILVGGGFTTLGGQPCSRIGRLNPDGSLDRTFKGRADDSVDALALQPDGRILVGGHFSALDSTSRQYIGRLNADGSLDQAFIPGASGPVAALTLQPDGKVLVGGGFTYLGGQPRNYIGRLQRSGSLDTGFEPDAGDMVLALALQADGKVLVGGDFGTLGGQPRNRIGRLDPDGSLDEAFNPGADSTVYVLALQPDGKALVGGTFTKLGDGATTARSRVGRLNADGTPDSGFNPGAAGYVRALALQPDGKVLVGGSYNGLGGGSGATTRYNIGRLYPDGTVDGDLDPGANAGVMALALQPDGMILVGGYFTALGGGGTGTTPRAHIGRLKADGSLDVAFDPGAGGTVYALAVQPDGRILVGGYFNTLDGQPRKNIGRLNPDGNLDGSFDPGADSAVYALALQPDGKILVGGEFTGLGSGTGATPRSHIGRLNADGSVDGSFDPGADLAVNALALQPDGKVLAGGSFTVLGGQPRSRVGRVNADGSLDTAFNPGAGGTVYALAVQRDGKVLVGGDFARLGGGGAGKGTRYNVGRLNPDGSLDSGFNPGANGVVTSLAPLANGRVVLGGGFTRLGGGTGTAAIHNHAGRVNPNGGVDATFNAGANSLVNALAVQPDGKVLLGGQFYTLGGGGVVTETRYFIGRLSSPAMVASTLAVSKPGTTVFWLRGGAGPEVTRVAFDATTDGVHYWPLGEGTRIPAGWQLTGLGLPWRVNVLVRARAFYGTGWGDGSSSLAEAVRSWYLEPAAPVFLPLSLR